MLLLEIRCDDCDVAGDSGAWGAVKAHILRSDLRMHGWVNEGGKDYCPKCWQRRKREGRK